MHEIADMRSEVYHLMAKSQDEIGWRQFMEGMVSCWIIDIQWEYFALRGTSWRLEKWVIGLVTHLLEVTHGQWLYQNVMVHDAVTGLAGSVGNMSATCCPDSQMLALLAHISLSWRHKTDSDTVFLCRGMPTFTPFFLEYQRYIRRIPL